MPWEARRLAGDRVTYHRRRLGAAAVHVAEEAVADVGEVIAAGDVEGEHGLAQRHAEDAGTVAPARLTRRQDEQDFCVRRQSGGVIGGVEMAKGGLADDTAPQPRDAAAPGHVLCRQLH